MIVENREPFKPHLKNVKPSSFLVHKIVPFQSAYRRSHSTETALLKVQSDILESLDNGCVTVLVLLDLSAAFDTLAHGILLHRFENLFGIPGATLGWIASYLHDRCQVVAINGDHSDTVLLERYDAWIQ